MPDVFLSYSRDDQATARRFAEALEREGLSVWWDATLRSGEDYDEVTGKALKAARAVVVLWSRKSVESRWVRTEATIALQRRTLMPVMIEPCERPIMFELTHTADLAGWTGSSSDPAWRNYVAHIREIVEKGEPAPADAPPTPVALHKPRSIMTTGMIAILLLLVLGAGLTYWYLRPQSPEPAKGDVSLAVLPFADISAEQNQEYISDGLSEEILNQLAQIKALRVIARTSSFSFKGKNEDLRINGQKLGVNHLLEGSVRKNGEQLRITAQLINAADGSHLWSQTYARKMDDVFAVQEEIAKDVAKALSITLDVGELRRGEGGTTNVAAYEKYLQARAVSINSEGPAANEQVAQLSREAVALDPGFALAWFMLKDALGGLAFFYPARAAQLQKEAAEARARAIALTPDAPWVKAMIAIDLVGQHKWLEAESALREAGNSDAVSGLNQGGLQVRFLLEVGRVADALRLNEQVLKREPLSLVPSMDRQMLLDAAGRPAEAQAEYQRSLAFAGNNLRLRYLAVMRLLRQSEADPAAVRAQIKEFTDLTGVTAIPGPGLLLLDPRNPADGPQGALARVRKAMDAPEQLDSLSLVVMMDVADANGDRDLALKAMRRNMVDLRFEPDLIWQPFKTGLRTDPKFKQIVLDIGLVDYWRKTGNWGDFCKPVGNGDFECQ